MTLRLGIGTRDETIARMTSRELTAWQALFAVHAEEAEHAKHVAESGDGVVVYSGRSDDDDE